MPVLGRERLVHLIHRHVGDRVDVHVPQAGDEEPARRVDPIRIVRGADLVGRADGRDAVACDENCVFGTERPIPNVDNSDADDGDGGRLRAGAAKNEQAEDANEALHDLT